jgi:hypothetical protein
MIGRGTVRVLLASVATVGLLLLTPLGPVVAGLARLISFVWPGQPPAPVLEAGACVAVWSGLLVAVTLIDLMLATAGGAPGIDALLARPWLAGLSGQLGVAILVLPLAVFASYVGGAVPPVYRLAVAVLTWIWCLYLLPTARRQEAHVPAGRPPGPGTYQEDAP